MNKVALALATWFGCGYFPKGPGTVGSLGAIAVALLLSRGAGWSPVACGVAVAVLFFPAVWASQRVARLSGREDPQIVVVDEVAGQWMAFTGVSAWNWKSILAAFVLFRLFDIWKPSPVREAEKLPGGWGIMADDVVAGLYASLVLWALGWFNFL